jgi:hypothetical protein
MFYPFATTCIVKFVITIILVEDVEQFVLLSWVEKLFCVGGFQTRHWPFTSTPSISRWLFLSLEFFSQVGHHLIRMGPSNEALQFLLPIFAEFCVNEFATETKHYWDLVSNTNLTSTWCLVSTPLVMDFALGQKSCTSTKFFEFFAYVKDIWM